MISIILINSHIFQVLFFFVFFTWIFQLNLYPLALINNSILFSFSSRNLREILIFLTFFIVLIIYLAIASSSITFSLNFVFWAMSVALIFIFRTNRILTFYFFFEASLLPIFLIIIGWGYQPERLRASLNLIIYTITASLPILLVLIFLYFTNTLMTFSLAKTLFSHDSFSLKSLFISFSLRVAFLVKIPIFIIHLWLPKAHVEAPVVGSIILAALLLKLGGYGIAQFLPFVLNSWFMKKIIFSLRLLGGSIIRFLCVRQRDIKVLIAYSSVAHIRLVIARLASFSYIGIWAAFRIMVAHAFSSSGLFLGAFYLYLFSGSRALHLRKSFLSLLPRFSLMWFILCLANMGGPPTFNLFREIANFSVILNWSLTATFFIFFIAGLAVAYSLILYSLSQHNNKNSQVRNLSFLNQSSLRNLFLHGRFRVFFVFFLNFILYTNIKHFIYSCPYFSNFVSCYCLLPLLKRK